MINLLLIGWCEAPNRRALHLSTFVHQVLSVIAERGGASAKRIFATLCEKGPFRSIEPPLFVSVLRHLGSPDVALIEQSEDGMLLLGRTGEKVVEHYSFYAVFKTPEEYRIVHQGETLGTLPIMQVLAPKMALIFSGRRWEVLSVEEADKTILVKPAPAGRPPKFGGEPGLIDDRVIQEMKRVYLADDIPQYLDETAAELLCEARRNFKMLDLETQRIVSTGETKSVLTTWQGSVKSNTLALALAAKGFIVAAYDGLLDVDGKNADCALETALSEIQAVETPCIFLSSTNLIYDKFHPYLSSELLQQDAMSGRLDLNSLPALADIA
jgi:ATP-dependent Lhr-like helicase